MVVADQHHSLESRLAGGGIGRLQHHRDERLDLTRVSELCQCQPVVSPASPPSEESVGIDICLTRVKKESAGLSPRHAVASADEKKVAAV